MSNSLVHHLEGVELSVLAEKAVWWASARILLLADLHIGKATHFRRHGLPVPMQTAHQDLARLSALITRYRPQRVIFLGDLFHSRPNEEQAGFGQWMAAWPEVSFELVPGNHDVWANLVCGPLVVHPGPVREGPFVLTHEPMTIEGYYNLYGHLHPAVQMEGPARQRLRLPCFWFGQHACCLPAFSDFSGHATIRPRAGDSVYVLAGGQVLRV